MSPRRSSRARSSQLPAIPGRHTNSTLSATSNKPEKIDRSIHNGSNRTGSPRRASTVRSESNDEDMSLRGSTFTDLQPRRSRRGNDADGGKEKDSKANRDSGELIDDEVIEEDITRCVCGQPEYPGPGASIREQQSTSELPDTELEIGNFFVQCDRCHVWQHGGCLGLTEESMLPDEYYCESCKPEYHLILRSSNGMKSSKYLPVLEGLSDRSSILSSADPPRKGNEKRRSMESTKRRATMNSRGAYDEDEMIRRAIEESKETGSSLGKRSREDNEESKPAIKRQRTASSMSSSESRRSRSPPVTGLDAQLRSVPNSKVSGKLRGAAAKNSKEKELRDKQKEQIAVQRADAASKRHARSERRRGDESPPPSPSVSPSKPTQLVITNSKTKADTPPSSKAQPNRKGGRASARRGRLGRNQYTRDLPLNGDTSDSPLRDISDDKNGVNSPRVYANGVFGRDNVNGESGKSSRAKTHSARTSMNEMKRRVAAIMEFVGRMQTERVIESTPYESSTSSDRPRVRSDGTAHGSPTGNRTPGNETATTVIDKNADVDGGTTSISKLLVDRDSEQETTKQAIRENNSPHVDPDIVTELKTRKFEEMNSSQMMENIMKDLVNWQGLYGIYTR